MGEKSPDELHFFPFAYALYNENLSAFCWYCLGEHKPHKRCVGCGTAMFCNKECQMLAWKDHKFECRALKFGQDAVVPDIEVRLLGRIVVRHKTILCGKDKEDPTFYKDRTSKRTIMDIWAHTKNISEDPFVMKKFNVIYEALLKFYEAKALLPREVIFQLHCRDLINRHAISDKAYVKEVGKGLYLDLCAYDHSCRPNAIYVCDGFKAILRPLSGGTNLLDRSTTFYSYIDLLHAKQERRKLLKDTWYFNCECERCRDNQEHILTSINCPNCTTSPPARLCLFGNQPYKDTDTQLLTCPKCSVAVPREAVVEALATMRFVDSLLGSTQTTDRLAAIEFLENMRERVRQLLPDVNVYCCKIVQALIPLIDPRDNCILLRLHLNVEECLRVCYPHNHPALGFHLRNIGIFALRLGDRSNLRTSVKYLEEAAEIFAFVMRDGHSMTTTTRDFLEEVRGKLRAARPVKNIVAVAKDTVANAQRSTPCVMLRCEVFAESIDKDTVTDDSTVEPKIDHNANGSEATISEEQIASMEIMAEEVGPGTVITIFDLQSNDGEEMVEQIVELTNCEAAAAMALPQNGGAHPVLKKRKEFEYAGSLKCCSKKTTLAEEGHSYYYRHHRHHHHLIHDSRHHSETRIPKGGVCTEKWNQPLEVGDLGQNQRHDNEKSPEKSNATDDKDRRESDRILGTGLVKTLEGKVVPHPNQEPSGRDSGIGTVTTLIPCIVTAPDATSSPVHPTFGTLFVDTSSHSLSSTGSTQTLADSVGGRTGVKKKAALKKISPRARTPLPPFKATSSEPPSPNPATGGPVLASNQLAAAFPFVGVGSTAGAVSEPTTADISFSLVIPTVSTDEKELENRQAEAARKGQDEEKEDEEYGRNPSLTRRFLTMSGSVQRRAELRPESIRIDKRHRVETQERTVIRQIVTGPNIEKTKEPSVIELSIR